MFCSIYLIIFAAINQLSINRKQFRSEMKTTIFCGLIATCLLAGSAIPGSAQNKRWEHNLYEGVGMAKKFDSHDNQTVAFHVAHNESSYSVPSLPLQIFRQMHNRSFYTMDLSFVSSFLHLSFVFLHFNTFCTNLHKHCMYFVLF